MAAGIDALIFDLDGTLVDSIADIGQAMNSVLAELSLPPHGMEAYKAFVGEGAEHLVLRSIRAAMGVDGRSTQADQLPAPLPELVNAYRTAYGRVGNAHSRPYPGIAAMLDQVTESGRKMAVLSNKRDEFSKSLVAHVLGRWPFVEVRGELEGIPRKPHPASALELAQRLGVPPERVALVGDTSIDMATARSAGMVPIGVLWGFRSEAELRNAGAWDLLKHPSDLAPALHRFVSRETWEAHIADR